MQEFVQIAANAFDDDRVVALEAMPAGDSAIVLWLKLVAQMGQKSEAVDTIVQYADAEELAARLRTNISTLRAALSALQTIGLVELVPGGVKVNGGGSIWA